MKKRLLSHAVACALLVTASQSWAFRFEKGGIKGSFTSTVSAGTQYSLQALDPDLNTNHNGHNRANYAHHGFVSTALKGVHELDVQFPDQWALFARGTWLRDFQLADTKDPLSPDAKDRAETDIRLLDFFVEKSYTLGDQFGRIRVGNQVLNWGESLFNFGGINYATNPVDIQRAVLPGGQVKEILVPVPMVSINQGLGNGLSTEAYYQFDFKAHRFPPVDTFWSTTNLIGEGSLITMPLSEGGLGGGKDDPKSAQYGISLKYQPEDSITEYGLYYARYNEKFPWVRWDSKPNPIFGSTPYLTYAQGIDMYGFSFNTDVGEWAVGGELAYRPNDVIALDPFGSCFGVGTCLRKQKRWSFDATAINLMSPSGDMGWLLNGVGADSGIFMVDVGGSYVPGLNPQDTDVKVSLDSSKSLSWGYAVEADLSYEGSLIPGWTVTPGVYFRHGVSGSSHELLGWWRNEAKEVNAFVNFTNQNDLTIGVQYLGFWGGDPSRIVDNGDKDVLALTISKTF